jgi:undecaprenyl-diphosphatase
MPSARLGELKAALPRMAVLAGIWAVLVGLLIAVGELVVHSAAVTHFDRHATSVLVDSRTAPLNSAMKAVTWLGSWVALTVMAVIVVVLVLTRRLPLLAAVVTALAWAGEAGGVRIGKAVVARDRPPEATRLVQAHGWSFPSGHAAAATLAFTVLAMCVTVLARHRAVRVLGWLIAVLAIAATAFSRVELGVHWTTDVIASVVFTAAWLTAIGVVLGARLRELPGLVANHRQARLPCAAERVVDRDRLAAGGRQERCGDRGLVARCAVHPDLSRGHLGHAYGQLVERDVRRSPDPGRAGFVGAAHVENPDRPAAPHLSQVGERGSGDGRQSRSAWHG